MPTSQTLIFKALQTLSSIPSTTFLHPLPRLTTAAMGDRPHLPLRLSLSNQSRSANALSPMTDLAFNLDGLHTGYVATPKRRISWSSTSSNTPTPNRNLLPNLCDQSQDEETVFLPERTRLLRRQRSVSIACSPVLDKENLPDSISTTDLLFRSDSVDDQDTASQDSGYSGLHLDKDKPVRRLGSWRRGSADLGTWQSSLDGSDEEDDGFLDICTLDSLDEETTLPLGFSQLLQGPLVSSERLGKTTRPCLTERDTNIERDGKGVSSLFGGCLDHKNAFKRPDPPLRETPPTHHSKRRKAMSFCNPLTCETEENAQPLFPRKTKHLHRCHSETEATIMRALQRSVQFPDLIGDFSKPYTLPLIPGKHQDLKTVEPQTVQQLIEGVFETSVEQHIIVDCRYPYEFDGGHIKGAKNIYTKDGIMREFIDNPTKLKDGTKRLVIVFHCEFSSERGPALTRFLRNKDRDVNKECYPSLHYPEVYLMNGGYKAFFELCKEWCEPQDYKPMLHKDHENDMRICRARSKSWNGESKGRVAIRPGLKF